VIAQIGGRVRYTAARPQTLKLELARERSTTRSHSPDKIEVDGRDGSARQLYLTKDAACSKESQIDYLNSAPIVREVIDGLHRTILLDTGSNLSLIQPGVRALKINRASVTLFGVTGDELREKGEQLVTFTINEETYGHEFYV
jgi:hypothetical protein